LRIWNESNPQLFNIGLEVLVNIRSHLLVLNHPCHYQKVDVKLMTKAAESITGQDKEKVTLIRQKGELDHEK